MTVNVGSAYGTIELRYQQFTQGVSAVEAQLRRLRELLKTPISLPGDKTESNKLGDKLRRDAAEANKAIRQFQALERQYDRTKDSAIRAARAQGDYARALRLVDSELSRAIPDTVRYNNLLAQQASIKKQAAGNVPSSMLGGFNQALGAAGFAVGAQQIIQFGTGAIQAANNLERTEATVTALSGSVSRYNQVLEVARAGQQRYGGSLAENLRGLGSLVNLSNRSGASLQQLDNVSRRLAVVDPVQGIEGANIALKEFLTGTGGEAALSLARRFELPRKAIAALAKEGISAKDKLAALDKLLADQGITQAVLTNQTNTTAAAYTQLAAAASNAEVAIGGVLAKAFAPAARGGTAVLDAIAGQNTQETIVGVANATQQLYLSMFGIPSVQSQMSEGQKDLTRSFLEFIGIQDQATKDTEAAAIAMRKATDVEDRRARVLAALRGEMEETDKATDATNQKIAESILSADDLRKRQEELTNASQLAAQGLLGAGNQALILAGKYNIAEEAARGLIAKQQAVGFAPAGDPRDEFRFAKQRVTPDDARRDARFRNDKRVADEIAANQARLRQQQELENSTQRVVRLQKELQALTKQGVATTSAQYLDKQTELIKAQRTLAAEQEAAAKSNARAQKSAISDAEKRLNLEEKTADAIRRRAQAAVDAELDIIDDRRKKREEERRVQQARRVLANPNASSAQREAALDVLAEVPLLQEKRRLAIQGKQEEAGAELINGKLYQSRSSVAPSPIAQSTPSILPAAPVGSTPIPLAAPVPAALMPMVNVNVRVFLSAEEIARRIEVDASDGVIVKLEQGLNEAIAGGFGRNG